MRYEYIKKRTRDVIEALIKDISPVFIYNTFHHPLIAININAIAAFSLASSTTIGVSLSSSSSSSPRILLFSSSFATAFATSAFEEFARSIAASTMQHVLVLELLAVVVCIIMVFFSFFFFFFASSSSPSSSFSFLLLYFLVSPLRNLLKPSRQ